MNRAAAVRIAVLVALSALVAMAVRVLRGDPAPVFTSPGPFPKGTINPASTSQASTSRSTSATPDHDPSTGPSRSGDEEVIAGATEGDPAERGASPGNADDADVADAASGGVTELFPTGPGGEGESSSEEAAGGDGEVTGAIGDGESSKGDRTAGDAEPNPPGERWVFPVDGECPESHPIKAKLRSGLYHLPGMMAYDRAKPDRCYATEVDALADGLRRAKR